MSATSRVVGLQAATFVELCQHAAVALSQASDLGKILSSKLGVAKGSKQQASAASAAPAAAAATLAVPFPKQRVAMSGWADASLDKVQGKIQAVLASVGITGAVHTVSRGADTGGAEVLLVTAKVFEKSWRSKRKQKRMLARQMELGAAPGTPSTGAISAAGSEGVGSPFSPSTVLEGVRISADVPLFTVEVVLFQRDPKTTNLTLVVKTSQITDLPAFQEFFAVFKRKCKEA